MHRDKQVGLALGILLVGVVGAFFFRQDSAVQLEVPSLDDPAQLDAMIEEIDRPQPYPANDTASRSPQRDPRATGFATPPIEVPVTNEQWVENERPDWGENEPFPIGPPDPIAFDPASGSQSETEPPIPLADPNSQWSNIGHSSPSGTPAAPAARPETYKVQRGDTLSDIAERLLGTSRRYMDIYRVNRDRMKSPNDLQPGMELRIPLTQRESPPRSAEIDATRASTAISPSSSHSSASVPAEPSSSSGEGTDTPIVSESRSEPSPSGTDRVSSTSVTAATDSVRGAAPANLRDSSAARRPESADDARQGTGSTPATKTVDRSESRFVPYRRSPFAPRKKDTRRAADGSSPGTRETQTPVFSEDEPRGQEKSGNSAESVDDLNAAWKRVHQKSPAELGVEQSETPQAP